MFGSKKTDSQESTTTASNTTPSSHSSKRATPSVIANQMHVLGNIRSNDFIDIDGTVEGNITCQSTTIRENGTILGDIVADKVNVYGRVEGMIKSKNVVLHASAHVEGVIMHESLSIEDGAFVDGKFKRLDKVFVDDVAPEPDDMLDDPLLAVDDPRNKTSDEDENDDDLKGLEKNLRLIN